MQRTSENSNSRHRLILLFAGLALAALCRFASGQTVPVTANMVDGSNNPVPAAYLHFDLYNCGPNYPMLSSFTIAGSVLSGTFQPGEIVKQGTTNVTAYLLSVSPFVVAGLSSRTANSSNTWVGQTSVAIFTPSGVPSGGQIIVQRSFDLQQSSNGLITGTVVPNDLIVCGNATSTQWTVTPMKSGATPLNAAQRYFICSVAGTGTPPCAQASAGATFDPSTAQPAQISPQPPGFSLTYANPVATQEIDQPPGTQFNWLGTVNFCSATVLCGSSGSGNLMGTLTPGIIPQPSTPTTLINSTPQLDNGVTTPNTLTYAGSAIALPSDGVHAGGIGIVGNTAIATWVASHTTNYFGFLGPSSASFTSYFFQPNPTPPTVGQAFVAGTPSTCPGSSAICIPLNYAANGGSGGGNPTLDNCTPDQTGNSFYSVTSLTNYFFASWQFVFGQASYINCTVFIPTAQTGATIVLDIAANDGTAGHTANFQTCDIVINSGTINVGSPSCAANQTFTTTSTAYNRVTLTFNVQSTLSNNSILVIKIATTTTGTAPTANMLVYPHFIL